MNSCSKVQKQQSLNIYEIIKTYIHNYTLEVHRSKITDNNLYPLCKIALQEHCKKLLAGFFC